MSSIHNKETIHINSVAPNGLYDGMIWCVYACVRACDECMFNICDAIKMHSLFQDIGWWL